MAKKTKANLEFLLVKAELETWGQTPRKRGDRPQKVAAWAKVWYNI